MTHWLRIEAAHGPARAPTGPLHCLLGVCVGWDALCAVLRHLGPLCVGLRWFALVYVGFVLVCVGLRWFALVLCWFVLVCVGLRWFVMVLRWSHVGAPVPSCGAILLIPR